MKSFRQYLAALMVAVTVLAVSVPMYAANKPLDPSGNGDIPLEFVGAKPCRVTASTTASLCTGTGNKQGLVYGFYVWGTNAVAGQACALFDSAVAAQVTSYQANAAYLISPSVFGSVLWTEDQGVIGKWEPRAPMRFETGLVVKCDGVNVDALAVIRLDTGVNP